MSIASKPIIICGQQRSGTTALQSALSRVDGVRNFGEIFQFHKPLIDEAPHNFYYYVNNVRGGWVAITSAKQAEEEMLRYFDYLGQLTEGSHYVADIKYNLWHHFAPGWLNSMGRPFMLEIFKKLGVPIIHVIRRDTFRQFVSYEFADRARKWHYGAGDACPELAPFNIHCGELAEHLEMVEGNVALFRKRLAGYPSSVELVYEHMFEGTRLRPAAEASIRKILPGWIVDGAESHFVKPEIDQMAKVANAEAVIEYFRNTKFGVMVMDALRPPLPPVSHQSMTVGARREQSSRVITNTNVREREPLPGRGLYANAPARLGSAAAYNCNDYRILRRVRPAVGRSGWARGRGRCVARLAARENGRELSRPHARSSRSGWPRFSFGRAAGGACPLRVRCRARDWTNEQARHNGSSLSRDRFGK